MIDSIDAKDKSAVFVRSVSFAVDQSAVEAAFADVGPIRKCFLVKGKGQDKHKGYGFVQFALSDDAARAVKELNNTLLGDRRIQVEQANKRTPFAERKRKHEADITANQKVESASVEADSDPPQQHAQKDAIVVAESIRSAPSKPAKQLRKSRPNPEDKQRLVRTIALGNLSSQNKQAALRMAEAAGKVAQILDPGPDALIASARLARDGCQGDVVFVEYDTVKSAMSAVAQLHGQTIRECSNPASKRMKTGEHSSASPAGSTLPELWARQVSGEGALLKKWRVIVRNLAFRVTEEQLKAALQAAGFVWELTVPRTAEGRLRGFAFAGYTCRAHAEKAIALVNGQKLAGRVVVVDWAVAKADFQRAALGADAPELEQPAEAPAVVNADGTVGEIVERQPPSSDSSGSLDSGQEKVMQTSVLESILQSAASSHGGPTEENDAGAGADDDASPADSLEEKTSDVKVRRITAAEQQPAAAPAQPVISSGPRGSRSHEPGQATVFVRGMPLDTTQQQLQTAMLKFGKVKSCRLVINKAAQKPKGTAFVEFCFPDGAHRAVQASKQQREEAGSGIVVNGQVVEVDAALSQDAARTLAFQKGNQSSISDGRNLYLAKEGHIEEGSAAWEALSMNDRNRRKRAAEEKNLKLRSPNFSVSATRLSLRNLPLSLDERKLKQLVVDAVKERAIKENPRIKQVKILREPSKSGLDGTAKSKGLGFVEFMEHEHALCALRQLNNNPQTFGQDRRPIVEFAIENVNILKKRQLRQKALDRLPAGPDQKPRAPAHKMTLVDTSHVVPQD